MSDKPPFISQVGGSLSRAAATNYAQQSAELFEPPLANKQLFPKPVIDFEAMPFPEPQIPDSAPFRKEQAEALPHWLR